LAEWINISRDGFGLDSFTSKVTDIINATVEENENFIPPFVTSGINQKSLWYRFRIPTSRAITVGLRQTNDTTLQPGSVGFTVYRTDRCFPDQTDLSLDLTPIERFGYTFHPCVDAGEYLIQVSGNALAKGPIYLYIITAEPSPAPFDKIATAQELGKVNVFEVNAADFDIRCLSVEDTLESCLPGGWSRNYTKSSWHILTTPDEFTYFTFWFGRMPMQASIPRTVIGYRLFEGNIKTTPLDQLVPVNGCDSFVTNAFGFDYKNYRCDALKRNTTYTVQLVYQTDSSFVARFAAAWDGKRPLAAPPYIDSLPPIAKVGILNVSEKGSSNFITDVFGCNSQHGLYNCPSTLPAKGLLRGGYYYNLSTLFNFRLTEAANLYFNSPSYPCGPPLLFRIYRQSLDSNCAALDSSRIIGGEYTQGQQAPCVDTGNYVLQVMGVDSSIIYNGSPGFTTSWNNGLCTFHHFGMEFSFDLFAVKTLGENSFSLSSPQRIERINASPDGTMSPLQKDITYFATDDIFGCNNTVMPDSNFCGNPATPFTKGSYRTFTVDDSLILHYDTLSFQFARLYKGDASVVAAAENKFHYPQVLKGLQPFSNCVNSYERFLPYQNSCLVPGTYTIVSFKEASRLGDTSMLRIRVTQPETKYFSPATTHNMGNLVDSSVQYGTQSFESTDVFPCRDNYAVIDGRKPCDYNGQEATKLIYRQFYIPKPTIIRVRQRNDPNVLNVGYSMILFKGRATAGLDSLKYFAGCNGGFDYSECNMLPAGWYTLVTYGYGPTYDKPLQGGVQGHNISSVGIANTVTIYLTPCPVPRFNRPYKASVDPKTNQPYSIAYGPENAPNAAYPATSREYYLETENMNCTPDIPLSSHPLIPCTPDQQHVAYYVFKIEKESYVKIITDRYNAQNGFWAVVFPFDVRKDSARMVTTPPLQNCLISYRSDPAIHICRIQPGIYTLVITTGPSLDCRSVTPKIYVDRVESSRFDHAAKAYDFGAIIPDSSWYDGRKGDINPFVSSRAASSDFIYCTTGARPEDPIPSGICATTYNPLIYPDKINNVLRPTQSPTYNQDRRNLWYTFVAKEAGYFTIRVPGKTPGREVRHPFAVYRSDEDGSIPFNTLVQQGKVDSTFQQGLTLIGDNIKRPDDFCDLVDSVSFFINPCYFKPTRYYIVVDNTYGAYYELDEIPNYYKRYYPPNSQVNVEILHTARYLPEAQFDHYSLAYNLGTVEPNGNRTRSATDNFTCATRDEPDPIAYHGSCSKTLWYKFKTNSYGAFRFRVNYRNNNFYTNDQVQLFLQNKAGDSSAAGLQLLEAHTVNKNGEVWAQRCIYPGTYYLLLPGCGATNEDVFVEVEMTNPAGDFCSAPLINQLNGPGSAIASVTVDCHTIGSDYGEYNPTLSCPPNTPTNLYKSSWYRLDIGGKDTLDVTIYTNNQTNAGSTEVKYRMMTGDCGAMQEQSCVLDALTRNTYKCLTPGKSYYIQLLTPLLTKDIFTVGNVDLITSAVVHQDACVPVDSCIASSNFIPQYNCAKDKFVYFNNYSTFGTNIEYTWDFGYNNQKSNVNSPRFQYPSINADRTYTVTLITRNIACGKTDTMRRLVNIPGKPEIDLGRDTIVCATGTTYLLNATTFAGSKYRWFDGSTKPTYLVKDSVKNAWVEVTYNGCKTSDTISVWLNPLDRRSMKTYVFCDKDRITLNALRGKGERYVWNTGAVTPEITVTQPGYYWCDLFIKNCVLRDSFLLLPKNIQPLGKDTPVCEKALPILLDAFVYGATSYQWQDQATGPTKTAQKEGTYWVDILVDGCRIRDSIEVEVIKPILIGATSDTSLCEGSSMVLEATGAESYLWYGPGILRNNGEQITIRPNGAATYYVTGYSKKRCYSSKDTIRVTNLPVPSVYAGPDVKLTAGRNVQFNPTYSKDVKAFLWTPSDWLNCNTCISPVASPAKTTSYLLTVTNNYDCKSSDELIVSVECTLESIFLPNTFTPNGDGVNDVFYPRSNSVQMIRYFRVYNRWGQLLFERSNIPPDSKADGWDGTYQGKILSPDVFVYTIGAECANGTLLEGKGNIMIVR
jgi:gliding motility-associated-like protein